DLRMVDGLGAVVVDTDRVPVPPGAELRAAGAETCDEGAQVWITGPAARGQAQVRDRVAGGGLPVRVESAGALVREHVLGRVACGWSMVLVPWTWTRTVCPSHQVRNSELPARRRSMRARRSGSPGLPPAVRRRFETALRAVVSQSG